MSYFIPASDLLLLHTAVTHGRLALADYLPAGTGAAECLDRLLSLFFDEALDDAVAFMPAGSDLRRTPADVLRQAIADIRGILIRRFGPDTDLDDDTCLSLILQILDSREVERAGQIAPLLKAEWKRGPRH